MSEACRKCGVPLAEDQRYCLNCGERCGPPRIDFGKQQPPRPSVPESAAPTESEPPKRDYTPLAAVGGIAILGLMLLIGVLIGKGNGTTTAAPPQVVRLGGEGGAGTTASNEGEEESSVKPKKAKSKSSAKAANGKDLVNGKGGTGPVEASDQALQELQEQSPDEYSKSSAKLPDEIATGGAPPPTDDKAPGGGSKGTAIE